MPANRSSLLLAATILFPSASGALFAQGRPRLTVDVGAGGGNVGGGAFSTEAKFVGSVTLSAQPAGAARAWAPVGTLALARYFGNHGPGYCAKFDALGQCIPRPPELLGGVVSGGVQWRPSHWVAISPALGVGYFRADGPTAASSPALLMRGVVVLLPDNRLALGLHAERGSLTDLAGSRVRIESVVLFARLH